jgi:Filamin/ABP280 repeat
MCVFCPFFTPKQADFPLLFFFPKKKSKKKGLFTITYSQDKAGSYSIDIEVNDKAIMNPTHATTIVPGSVKGSECVATGATNTAIAGVSQLFHVQLRDEFQNNITNNPGPAFVVFVSGSDDSADGKATYVADGVFAVSYTITKAGSYSISVKVDGESVANSPFDAKVVPDNTVTPGECTATGDELTSSAAGYSSFQVQIRDPHGNPINTEHKNLSWGIVQDQKKSDNGKATPGFHFNVSYISDGKYRLSYFQTLAGAFETRVTIQGAQIRDSPFETQIRPGPVSAAHCTAEGEGLTDCITNKVAEFTVTTRDRFQNDIHVTSGRSVVKADLSLAKSDETVDAAITDKRNGLYFAEYKIKTSGQYELAVTVAGNPIKNSPFSVKGTWEGLSVGAVVGIGLGAAALVGAALGGFILYRTKCSKRSRYQSIRD